METRVTSAIITYLKYTDTRPARLHAGWQTILDVGLLCSHRAYLNHAVVTEHYYYGAVAGCREHENKYESIYSNKMVLLVIKLTF